MRKFNVVALLIGLSLALVTTSAFKTVELSGTYGQVNGTGPWVDISLSPGPNQEYYCDLVGQLCHADFTSNPETDPEAEMIPDSEESGTLKIRSIEE